MIIEFNILSATGTLLGIDIGSGMAELQGTNDIKPFYRFRIGIIFCTLSVTYIKK